MTLLYFAHLMGENSNARWYPSFALTRPFRCHGLFQIRTARAMLGTNCSRSTTVHEVSHQLMHAVQQGLTWPDEFFVGKTLADEVRGAFSCPSSL